MIEKLVFTADDEDPKCGRCDNQDDACCAEYCGPEHGWYGYQRTEYKVDDKHDGFL